MLGAGHEEALGRLGRLRFCVSGRPGERLILLLTGVATGATVADGVAVDFPGYVALAVVVVDG